MTGQPDRTPEHAIEPFRLAPAGPEDFEVVAELFKALHAYNAELDSCFALAEHWLLLLHDYFVTTCHDPGVLWLLAWRDSRPDSESGSESDNESESESESGPVGLLVVKEHLDSRLFQHRHWTELMAIYVVPACRGTGLGEHLVAQARAWTLSRGCSRLQLYVTASNQQARAFYRRCGLRPVQEIWRLDMGSELESEELDSIEDPDTDLLEPGHHHYLGGE